MRLRMCGARPHESKGCCACFGDSLPAARRARAELLFRPGLFPSQVRGRRDSASLRA